VLNSTTTMTDDGEGLEAGIAIGIVVLFVGLVAAAMLMMLMNLVTPEVFSIASQYTPGERGAKGARYLKAAFNWWPLYVLFVSFFGLIARATYQSEVA